MNSNQITMLGFRNVATTAAVRTRAERLPSGQLSVQVQLVKEYFGSAFVDVKVFFLDEDRFEIESTNWEPIYLEEDVMTQYETTSLSRDAVDFRLVIRRPPE